MLGPCCMRQTQHLKPHSGLLPLDALGHVAGFRAPTHRSVRIDILRLAQKLFRPCKAVLLTQRNQLVETGFRVQARCLQLGCLAYAALTSAKYTVPTSEDAQLQEHTLCRDLVCNLPPTNIAQARHRRRVPPRATFRHCHTRSSMDVHCPQIA